ncbi:J domain-containing protein [Marinobacter similis]|uniref:Molecular chaperone DnaJ n=1 Tax=Marinobacter similis TaxID=1420916 RepID=W5YGC5_9GAMM|nr:molecular chaperone DnaJ [Marinobacter similis]AHI28257.1 molecular chaperone DnaJ [Marinobacter similis]
MQITLIFLVMSLFAALWLRSLPRKQRGPAAIKLSLIVGTVIVVALAVTGRLHFLFALLAFLYPLLRRVLPSLLTGGLTGGGSKAKPGNQSHVSSEVLEMSLDHDSGTMDGTILTGPMAGRTLSDLGESEFLELLRYCRAQDEDSARLLETYLDRRFGDSWRADDEAGSESGESAGGGNGGNASGPLTESEALDILGLEPGASREDIIQAHRRMMQKVHPDHGGSNYLAARINEAKECLLG